LEGGRKKMAALREGKERKAKNERVVSNQDVDY
jgi:hypothetical protein